MSKLWKASGICERALRKIGAFSVNDTAADPEELAEALYWLTWPSPNWPGPSNANG